jgi:hypothetical protein
METGDVRYRDKVNCRMLVGSGMRKGSEVIYKYVHPLSVLIANKYIN